MRYLIVAFMFAGAEVQTASLPAASCPTVGISDFQNFSVPPQGAMATYHCIRDAVQSSHLTDEVVRWLHNLISTENGQCTRSDILVEGILLETRIVRYQYLLTFCEEMAGLNVWGECTPIKGISVGDRVYLILEYLYQQQGDQLIVKFARISVHPTLLPDSAQKTHRSIPQLSFLDPVHREHGASKQGVGP